MPQKHVHGRRRHASNTTCNTCNYHTYMQTNGNIAKQTDTHMQMLIVGHCLADIFSQTAGQVYKFTIKSPSGDCGRIRWNLCARRRIQQKC